MTTSPQERATILLNKADMVLTSNQIRRDMLSSIEHQFDTQESSFDTSEASLGSNATPTSSVTPTVTNFNDSFNNNNNISKINNNNKNSNINNNNNNNNISSNLRRSTSLTVDRLLESEETRRSLPSSSSSSSLLNRQKSRFATVSELKTQLQDCHNALLTMRENANLKYRTLELEYVALTSTLASVQSQLDHQTIMSQQLNKEKVALQRQLQEIIGTDQAAWIQTLEESSFQVGQKLALEKLERAELTNENNHLKRLMNDCSQCQRRMPEKGHYHPTGGLWGNLLSRVKDMDPSLGKEETNVVHGNDNIHYNYNSISSANNSINNNNNTSPKAQPPPEMFLFQQQSKDMKDDLDADIKAMEQQMTDEITDLKNQWGRTPKVFVGNSKKKKASKKRLSNKKKKDAFSTLDDFFGAATLGLVDEEMDEEKSFYSLQQRSVSTMPEKRKKKKKRSKKDVPDSDDENVKEELAAQLEANHDRRALMTSAIQAKKSFRERLMGLGAETVAEEESFAFKSTRSIGLTRNLSSEITASVMKTVHWEPDAVDRTEEDLEPEERDELAKEVQAWGKGKREVMSCSLMSLCDSLWN